MRQRLFGLVPIIVLAVGAVVGAPVWADRTPPEPTPTTSAATEDPEASASAGSNDDEGERASPAPPSTPPPTSPPTSVPPSDPCDTGWCTRVVKVGGVPAHYLYPDGPRSVFVEEEGTEICARWIPIPDWDRPISPGVEYVWEVFLPDNTERPDTYVIALPRDGVTTRGPCDGPSD